ncbi:MAG: hypothetical protein U0L09_07770, partial [Christensenellales bacterium]|nr:hypothetical protein [Christensenellales bacterium]
HICVVVGTETERYVEAFTIFAMTAFGASVMIRRIGAKGMRRMPSPAAARSTLTLFSRNPSTTWRKKFAEGKALCSVCAPRMRWRESTSFLRMEPFASQNTLKILLRLAKFYSQRCTIYEI